MTLIQAHVFISGRVQGIGYRFSTQDVAGVVGVKGWVRNLPDGRVEAVFEGTPEQVEEMRRWCHQGPPGATVIDMVVEYEPPAGWDGFEIRRS